MSDEPPGQVRLMGKTTWISLFFYAGIELSSGLRKTIRLRNPKVCVEIPPREQGTYVGFYEITNFSRPRILCQEHRMVGPYTLSNDAILGESKAF